MLSVLCECVLCLPQIQRYKSLVRDSNTNLLLEESLLLSSSESSEDMSSEVRVEA